MNGIGNGNDGLQTLDLVKVYRKRQVVNRVSLEVRGGEIVGLLGPNGAGKTTTFRMVVGLIRPDHGQIFFRGREITCDPMYRRARMGIGYLPQEPTIFAQLTVAQNLLIVLETLNLKRAQRLERMETLLQEMRLSHLAQHKADRLSGGERRRLEIARTLVTEPLLIMLDEPFAAIDPKLVEGLQEAILNLKKRGIGILITDHKPRETLSITDRAYVINEGQILFHGLAQEVAKNKLVRKLYLGENFSLESSANLSLEKQIPLVKESMAQGAYEEILPLLTHLIGYYPDTAELYYLRAQVFARLGDLPSACLDLQSVLQRNAHDGEATRELAELRQQVEARARKGDHGE